MFWNVCLLSVSWSKPRWCFELRRCASTINRLSLFTKQSQNLQNISLLLYWLLVALVITIIGKDFLLFCNFPLPSTLLLHICPTAVPAYLTPWNTEQCRDKVTWPLSSLRSGLFQLLRCNDHGRREDFFRWGNSGFVFAICWKQFFRVPQKILGGIASP